MATARKQLVAVDATPYYHCVSRCVRRSFLCGEDKLTQKSYEHRRGWIEKKIQSLTFTYCIDVCAYAVMSNHYHLVLHINRDKAMSLTLNEVIEKWRLEHNIPVLVERWKQGQLTCQAEENKCIEIIESWRERLWSLSWFMKELNYDIACKANHEDNCTGHFWESRFKSQALLDERALAAAMTYVDLNPIRANIAKTPEKSEYTSIKSRIEALNRNLETAPCLHPFIGSATNEMTSGIPFRLLDYIELVDWTAREFSQGKASMSSSTPPILDRLNFNQKNWLKACATLERKQATAIGEESNLRKAKTSLNKSKINLYKLE